MYAQHKIPLLHAQRDALPVTMTASPEADLSQKSLLVDPIDKPKTGHHDAKVRPRKL